MLKRRVQILIGISIVAAGVAAPVLADDFVPPKAYVTTPGGINVADGSFTYSVTDLSIGDLSLNRFQVTGVKTGGFTTSHPATPLLGSAFTHNFDIYVSANWTKAAPAPHVPAVPARYKPIVHIGSSASGVYTEPTDQSSISSCNIDAYAGLLALSGGNYNYTDKDGTVYTFDSSIQAAGADENGPQQSQRAIKISYATGRVQTLTYTASPKKLKRVDDSSGYAIIFDYNAAGLVSDACGFDTSVTFVSDATTCAGASPKVVYGYDASGNLTSSTDVLNQATTYAGTSWGATCVQPPDYSTCKYTMNYNIEDNVSEGVDQTLADGTIWHVVNASSQVNNPDNIPDTDGENEASITDPNGKVTSFTFTNTSPYTITDANSHTTNYRYTGASQCDYSGPLYHDGSLLTEVDYPEGGKYLAQYSAPFNAVSKITLQAKPGSGLADRVVQYQYNNAVIPAIEGKPTAKIDAKGNETDWTYFNFGAVQTEMDPAPTAGAARPLKTYAYTQLYAYIKNSSGTLVQATAPIWMLTSETQCQTVAGSSTPTCDTSAGAVDVVTTYQYGAVGAADTLLLRGKVVDAGTGKLNLRTCYGYDSQGNKISETSPRAGLTTCP